MPSSFRSSWSFLLRRQTCSHPPRKNFSLSFVLLWGQGQEAIAVKRYVGSAEVLITGRRCRNSSGVRRILFQLLRTFSNAPVQLAKFVVRLSPLDFELFKTVLDSR